jgi:hypothetical protein
MEKEGDRITEIRLFSKKDKFPIKVKFLDKYNNPIDYILYKTSNERLLLQKPFLNNNDIRI